jgi:uncharacterized protein (TIGR03435 family)
MRRWLGRCCFGAFVTVTANAQAAAPAFDVVSVKHIGDVQSTMVQEGNQRKTTLVGLRFTGGAVSCKMTLSDILMEAYQVRGFQVLGPGWIEQEVYEIAARMPDGTSRETARLMLQTMLADRLGVKLHREQKEFSVFRLVVIPGTTRLEEVTPAPTSTRTRFGMDMLEADPGMPLSSLATRLARATGKPVLDETGKTGYYKVKLHWNATPYEPTPGVAHEIGVDVGMISALPQIGLKLEPVKRMMDSLVVEKASKEPTEN